MKKALKWFSALAASVLAFATMGLSGCDEVQTYEQYANASLYSVGSASFAATEVRKVEVDWTGGSIEISQSSDTVAVVEDEGIVGDNERMHYYLDGDVLKVKYCKSGYKGDIRSENKNLRIALPVNTSLDVDSVGAVVTLGAVELPKFSLTSVSGNLTAERIVCQETELELVSGKAMIGELSTKSLSVETVSGSVSVTRLKADFLDAESTSARLSFGLQKAVSAEVNSVSGDVIFGLEQGLGATVRMETATGKFFCEKEYLQTGARYDVLGDENALKCSLDVDVFSGNLYIV